MEIPLPGLSSINYEAYLRDTTLVSVVSVVSIMMAPIISIVIVPMIPIAIVIIPVVIKKAPGQH